MKKYYIGLVVLALLVLGLVGYTVYQGGLTKQDKKTAEAASSVADKLNSYIQQNYKVPASLAAAGIKDVPKEVTYSKLSNDRYKLCVTYKADLRGYGVSPATLAVSAFYSHYAGYNSSYYGGDNYEATSAYIDTYSHDKGQKCITVKPDLTNYNATSSTMTQYCDPSYEYYSFWKDYCATQDNTTFDSQVN
jgi:hypothetical protein